MHIYIRSVKENENYTPDLETQRINAFQSETRKKQSLTGYFLLKSIVKSMGYDHFNIIRSPHKKPVLDIPLHYSLSHSHNYVVCAVDESPIGIDIQRIDSKLLNIRRKTGEVSDDIITLTDHWVLKEAYIKYIDNTKIPLKAIHIRGDNPYIVSYEGAAQCRVITYEDYRIAICMDELKEVVLVHD